VDTIISWLKPIFLPLLKLSFQPPHLPEGSSLVRHLKPSDRWLGYRYLATLLGLVYQFVLVVGGAIALFAQGHDWAIALAILTLLLEVFGLGLALVITRVDFELRDYLVGDRSLRVAQGVMKREEVTLSYANIQNLEVTQGPIERVFGFKTLTISTAGANAGPGQQNSHLVTLVGLPDAEALRELILNMLKQHRTDAGLGDQHPAPQLPSGLDPARLAEVRDAALALKAAALASKAH
jgi:membrane protein YdbS with pleckstrin-like domain